MLVSASVSNMERDRLPSEMSTERTCEDLVRSHVAVDMSPTDQTWGNHEMYVRDDDSNKTAFVRPAGR